MRKGLLIVFEGIDGSGKTFAIGKIEEWLKQNYISCVLTHEPQEDRETGQACYTAIRDPNSKLTMLEKQKLYVDDRLDHIVNFIQPKKDQGQLELCDRYFMSTFAYGMSSTSEAELWKLHREIIGDKLIIPDLTFILDVTVEEAQKRLAKKDIPLDEFEKKLSFQEQVRANYLYLAADPYFGDVRVVDNMGEKGEAAEKIFQEILKIVK